MFTSLEDYDSQTVSIYQTELPTEAVNVILKPKDIQDVRELLRRLLPLELIENILEEAEYWPRIHAERTRDIFVDSRQIYNHQLGYQSTWCYLLSPPLPPVRSDSVRLKARRVEIQIKAFHEGALICNSYPSLHPSSLSIISDSPGPPSSFEAIIVKPHHKRDLTWVSEALKEPVNLLLLNHPSSPAHSLFSFTRWHIAANAVGIDAPQYHSVVWTREAEESNCTNADDSLVREGLGHELVRSLEPGDRIAILVSSEQRGWEKRVYGASIDIEYSIC
ncbi:hypothetical protein FB446DRAFT_521700 [Lentinula raphanica]|nr:hypothetical protein FB446DRAFT_521700 [Lentinula raphanica]